MPIYEYECTLCSYEGSITVLIADRDHLLGSPCPECLKGSLKRVFSPFSFRMQG